MQAQIAMETAWNCSDDGHMTTSHDEAPLLAAESLQPLLADPHVLVVDCRHDLVDPAVGRQGYAAGHIPGAVFASVDEDLAAPKQANTGRHPLPAPEHFAAVLGRWGFTTMSRVVAYDQGNGAWAARLWWMLRSRGHARVQVLDGGLAAWTAAGGATETTVPVITPTTVQTRPFRGTVDTPDLAALLASGAITLVDARPADRFAGRNETIDPVAGHIPGAISMPFTGNLGPDQRFLPAPALRARWSDIVARTGSRPIVAMCGSGVTACHNLLALELVGCPGTRLYAGSYSEWITDPARPVATGE
jgi:thiosulfate/3-mercaptopyruvate sulfurtransferase